MTGDQMLADIYGCGATIGHVARILNVSEASVSRWANGHRTPCEYNLARLRKLRDSLTAWTPAEFVENYLQTVDAACHFAVMATETLDGRSA